MSYLEKLVLLAFALLLIGISAMIFAAYVLTVLIIVTLISLMIYVYPYAHNAGVGVSERIAAAVGMSDRVVGLRYAFFTIGLWTTASAFMCGLTGMCLESLRLLSLDPFSLVMATVSLALVCGVPFGLTVGLHARAIDAPGGGPIAQALSEVRDRFNNFRG